LIEEFKQKLAKNTFYGSVFIETFSEQDSKLIRKALVNRKFNNKTVVIKYLDESKFQKRDFYVDNTI
jgi:hypothetical protein